MGRVLPGEVRALSRHLKLTRRSFVAGSAGVAVVGGCITPGRVKLYETQDELPPLAEDEDDMTKPYDPLVLYASCDCPPAPGEISPNVLSLKEPHNLPMEILAVRFRCYPLNGGPSNPTQFAFQTITGQGIGVKMDLGNIPVVNSAVPINCFGSAREAADQSVSAFLGNAFANTLSPPQDLVVVTDPVSGQTAIPVSYLWRLKYPLYVPPGAVLTPTFSALGQNHFPTRIEVTYLARTRPANWKPKGKIMVPWVTSFSSKSFDNIALAPAGQDNSVETDLVNPFSVPLEITRLVGVEALVVNGITAFGDAAEDSTDHRFRLSTDLIRSSRGDDIARTPINFGGLFPFSWRAWDIPGNWTLAPGEFYQLQINVAAVDYEVDNEAVGRAQYSVGMVGYRGISSDAVIPAAQAGEAS